MAESLDSNRQQKSNEIQLALMNYDAELAINFQKDCENLLKQFANRSVHNFNEFAAIWKQTEFTGIFEGQQFISMLEVFLENCYLIAKKFLFADSQFIRIGALYLLYSLFYKQPIKNWVKIRLTDTEFLKIHEILNDATDNNNKELQFIYNKLRLNNAFLYCCKNQEFGPHLQRFDLDNYRIFTDNKNDNNQLFMLKYQKQLEHDIGELRQIDVNYRQLLEKYQNKTDPLTTQQTIYTKMDEINTIFGSDKTAEIDLEQ